ncbi:protein NYNRIN-like [Camellia sinensis]|uniref:protein NYNRIN-like n=1 Tax=Camellia sinensis TaxID=4442 RepID=UPI001036A07B|nr:protein NYNRIN-like [Camellia sinensis]
MESGGSLNAYNAKYWESYNEILYCPTNLAITQYKWGLPVGHRLRDSLTMHQPTTMESLMQRINEHIRVEDDAATATEKENPVPADRRVVGKVHSVGQEGNRPNDRSKDQRRGSNRDDRNKGRRNDRANAPRDEEEDAKRKLKARTGITTPARELLPLTSPWLFALWGLDIVGPLPTAPGNRKFFIVATDYFTKWVEAELLATIKEKDVKKFVWQNVVTRFDIPKALISDNGTQFDGKLFHGFCEELKNEFYNSTPAYLQSNGRAEALNKTILDELKKRLEKAKGKCSTGKTPFALAYGMEAVIPLEIGMPTIRSESFQPDLNNEAVALELDVATYQQELSRKYNKTVHPRLFKIGDWVLRKVMGNTVIPGEGKLGANWEGPYKVTGLASKGAYHLEDLDGKAIPRSWNAANLKIFYF